MQQKGLGKQYKILVLFFSPIQSKLVNCICPVNSKISLAILLDLENHDSNKIITNNRS